MRTLIELPPSVKATVPDGALPVTLAVNVTIAPTLDGLNELASAVVVVILLTVCDNVALPDGALAASPLYAATMLGLPAARLLVAQAAVRVLPVPASATAPQPEIEVPPLVKFNVPIGLLPVTVAVNVTLAPTVDGLAELASVVVLAAVLTICDSVALVDVLLEASPL